MTTKTDGGPAFPSKFEIKGPAYDPVKDKNVEPGTTEVYIQIGMSLRDYFAAKAMQAAATNPAGADGFTFEQRAEWAYQQADAMLKERGNE